jgi:hypothetical protein
MPSFTSPVRVAGRLVAEQCRRLQAALEALAGEVRAAVARAVGQATGEAVREALRVILDGAPGTSDAPSSREGLWGPPRGRNSPTGPFDPYGPEFHDRCDGEPNEIGDDPAYRPAPADDGPDEGLAEAERPGAWSRAVAAGSQAASWWLRRHPGRFSLVAAAAIGVAAGGVALAGGRFVAAGSGAAAAALGILALADAARSVAAFVADAVE